MLIRQFTTSGLAHNSYLLAGEKHCAIIDPKRDIEDYVELAAKMNLKISHIFLTHIPTDYIAGHMELAKRFSAKIFASAKSDCSFNHEKLKNGDEIMLDNAKLKVLETPGHCPDHISYLVIDASRGPDPCAIFSGDALLVGDVGRPDIFPRQEEEYLAAFYDTLYSTLVQLPDFVEVYPAHTAGTICANRVEQKSTSTIGYEKKYNYALQFKTRRDFQNYFLTNEFDVPDYFNRCYETNKKGPQLIEKLSIPKAISSKELNDLKNAGGVVIIDIRDFPAFGGGHIRESWNISVNGNFPTYAGWLIPEESLIILVGENLGQVNRAITHLRRVGLDNTLGYLDGGVQFWELDGYRISTVPQLPVYKLRKYAVSGQIPVVVDVRNKYDFNKAHIANAINVPVADVRRRYDEFDVNSTLAVIGWSGTDSSTACSIFKSKGHRKVVNIPGGMNAWLNASYEVETTGETKT